MSATLDAGSNSTQMPTGTLLTRTTQEPIRTLPQFSTLVLHSIRSTNDVPKAREAYCAAFRAECLACGIQIAGEELLDLAIQANAGEPKLKRLRMGYCARRTCDSRFYQLTCNPAPGVDWAPIFAIKDGFASAPEEPCDEAPVEIRPRKLQWMLAAAAGLTILLVSLSWQLYTGGSIPFVRQPEKFQVDPAPSLAELLPNP
jgi:hypothetical protein